LRGRPFWWYEGSIEKESKEEESLEFGRSMDVLEQEEEEESAKISENKAAAPSHK
jgi:hypothetical protein